MNRKCVNCKDPISECMGSVFASDFIEAWEGKRKPEDVRELCGMCVQFMIDGVIISNDRQKSG